MAETVRWLTAEEQHAWRSFVRLHEWLGGHLDRLLQSDSRLSTPDFQVLVHLTDVPEGGSGFWISLTRWSGRRVGCRITSPDGRSAGS